MYVWPAAATHPRSAADHLIRSEHAWHPQLPGVSASASFVATLPGPVHFIASNITGSASSRSSRTHPGRRQTSSTFLPNSIVSPLLLGAGLQIIACVVSACGLVLQRASTVYSPKRVLQGAGLFFCVSTAVPDTLSYVLAPQSLLALLCCLEPLLVSGIAVLVLPEDAKLIKKNEVFAMVLCVLGTLGCAACAPSSSVIIKGPEEEGNMHVRFFLYALVAFPALGWFLWQEHIDERQHIPPAHGELLLPTIAGMSLALQRLFMASLGASLQADGLSLFAVISAFAILCGALSTLFHVYRGTQEQPPHVFVPIYCGISAAIQLVQSAVVLREYRDEPPDMCVYTLISAAISLGGVTHLYLEHVHQSSWLTLFEKEVDISNMEIQVT